MAADLDQLIASLGALDLDAYEEAERPALGEGASGVVILMRRRADRSEWALKQMRPMSAEETRRGLQEAQRMLSLRHPSLVEAVGVHVERLSRGRCEVSILMEYCAGGNVEALLRAGQPLGAGRVAALLAQLAVALDFVHANNLVHRDVKPANLLLLADGHTLKLADLGLARGVDSSSASRGAGTIAYMSTEAFTARPAPSMDIWSFGIVAVELASGHRPNNTTQTQAQVDALVALIPPTFTDAFREMVRSALHLDPAARPSAAELVREPVLLAAALAQHERSAVHVSPSLLGLQQMVDGAAWLAPHRIAGLPWEEVAGSAVKLCSCGAGGGDDPASRAAAGLIALVRAAPGNGGFSERYVVRASVLAFSRARAGMHVGKALDLSAKVASGLLSLEREVATAAPQVVEARRAVLRRLTQGYLSLTDALALGGVRILIAFHVTPSEEVARSILRGGFAILGSRDDGFFGQGIYLTLDSEYAIEEYGRRQDGQPEVALVVCAVLVGSAFPVVEMPQCAPA